MMSDPERWFDTIYRKHELLSDADVKDLCEAVAELLIEEANVQPVSSPVTVCGDIHGQFWDLLHIFELAGEPAKMTNYIFMGDFVDRGHHSLECFTLLMAIKARSVFESADTQDQDCCSLMHVLLDPQVSRQHHPFEGEP